MGTKKVLILAAGRGTRMGDYAETTHKSLLPIGQTAILSRIFEQFSHHHEFVIAVGYKAEYVKSYVALAHPDLKVRFIVVDKFEGPGAGPGYSAFFARYWLQEPFFLVCADTLWNEPFGDNGNWLGTYKVAEAESEHYCNVQVQGQNCTKILNKKRVPNENYEAFIGLAHIEDWALFFSGLAAEANLSAKAESRPGELELRAGLEALIENSTVQRREFKTWVDVGRYELYQKARERLSQDLFEKRDEFIYFSDDRVIKFFVDDSIVKDRLERSRLNTQVFPRLAGMKDHFYSYPYVPGVNFYHSASPARFMQLLGWLEDNLWQPVQVNESDCREAGLRFYYEKTHQRLGQFLKNNSNFQADGFVRGQPCEGASALLRDLNWHELTEVVPKFIHGDLQFANIIYNEKNDSFCLIDWRHNFAGELKFGDLYYDFAKLYSGLLVDFEQVRAGHFRFEELSRDVRFSLPRPAEQDALVAVLKQQVQQAQLDWRRVEVITGLIFLNMAGLHRAPLDKIFYSFGREWLSGLPHSHPSRVPSKPQVTPPNLK